MYSDGGPFRFSDLEGRLPEADRDLLSSAVFADEILEEEKAAEQAMACLRSLKSQDPRSEVAALRARIKAAERQGDLAEAMRLAQELDQDLARQPPLQDDCPRQPKMTRANITATPLKTGQYWTRCCTLNEPDTPIIPVQNPLRGVAPADERHLGPSAIMFPDLARDVDKQSLVAGRDGVWNRQPGGVQHLHALLKGSAGEWGNTLGTTQTTRSTRSIAAEPVRYGPP